MHHVRLVALLLGLCLPQSLPAQDAPLVMTHDEYADKAHAAWLGQITGVLLTLPFEHKVSAVAPVTDFPKKYTSAIADDDWYYEMCALRGFEEFGPKMTIEQLGILWQRHNCGTWGSSKQARLAMARGVPAAEAGLPQHNRLWFTIGPLFSCELYGILAPGRPNLAARMARDLGRINGHAEGLDGGIFSAALVSIAFREKDPREIVRQAARVIHADSPFRQCVDEVIALGEAGRTAREVFSAVEDRWHIEYRATNNAVANGGLLAACVWFGEGDYWKSINLAASAGDYVDADNVAAVAAAVVGVMHGTQALPSNIVSQLNDRILGNKMGDLTLTPGVDESIKALGQRTAAIGKRILAEHGIPSQGSSLLIPDEPIKTLPAETFRLSEYTRFWNPDWMLERAGFGGSDAGGLVGVPGMTYVDGEILSTYPRDQVRGLVLHRTLTVSKGAHLRLQAGVDAGQAWKLGVYVDNAAVFNQLIEAPAKPNERFWQSIDIDLSPYAGKQVTLRLLQTVLIEGKPAGNAYWRNLRVE